MEIERKKPCFQGAFTLRLPDAAATGLALGTGLMIRMAADC